MSFHMSWNPIWLRLVCVALTPIAIFATPVGAGVPAAAQQVAAADDSKFDVPQLFASICGFCHSNGGRSVGKGPRLMDTKRSDEFIINRIKNGKEGAMPAFGTSFDDAQIAQIIKYIRSLKPE
jgi:mono/diheme cytochrome c family protein